MKRRTRVVVGAFAGAGLGGMLGGPVTMVLTLRLYMVRTPPALHQDVFTALVWGSFVAFGGAVGATVGYLGGRPRDQPP